MPADLPPVQSLLKVHVVQGYHGRVHSVCFRLVEFEERIFHPDALCNVWVDGVGDAAAPCAEVWDEIDVTLCHVRFVERVVPRERVPMWVVAPAGGPVLHGVEVVRAACAVEDAKVELVGRLSAQTACELQCERVAGTSSAD